MRLICIAVACVMLAACANVKTTTQVVAPATPAATAAAHPRPHGIPLRAILREAAASGVPRRVFAFGTVNPDCTAGGVAIAHTVTPPAHGTVAITQVEDYPHFPPTNPRYACNKIKFPSLAIRYTSEQGYVGTDTFTISWTDPNGQPFERVFVMNVRS